MGPEKTQDLLKGWTPMSCKGQVQKMKAWLQNHSILSEDQKKELAQKKYKIPVEGPKAFISKNTPQKVPNKDKKAPERNPEGKEEEKGKEMSKWNKPYPQNYRIPKKEKTSIENVFNMERTLMELQKKEDERLNQ
ncbi:hypothetical protein O181_023302 [Austropuccinia psidii MF-1]|uniref:Uncharacterized protein n=1 Tax=Austropuccinia psidii MF-1 TaxID=1389203 RepID=A0A9Q3CJ95_9BASI|nr:hypothetical protein [Austropuccinia psidii MF-1]